MNSIGLGGGLDWGNADVEMEEEAGMTPVFLQLKKEKPDSMKALDTA